MRPRSSGSEPDKTPVPFPGRSLAARRFPSQWARASIAVRAPQRWSGTRPDGAAAHCRPPAPVLEVQQRRRGSAVDQTIAGQQTRRQLRRSSTPDPRRRPARPLTGEAPHGWSRALRVPVSGPPIAVPKMSHLLSVSASTNASPSRRKRQRPPGDDWAEDPGGAEIAPAAASDRSSGQVVEPHYHRLGPEPTATTRSIGRQPAVRAIASGGSIVIRATDRRCGREARQLTSPRCGRRRSRLRR